MMVMVVMGDGGDGDALSLKFVYLTWRLDTILTLGKLLGKERVFASQSIGLEILKNDF